MNNVAARRVSDRLWASDPGGLRLRNALRSTTATTITGIVSIFWAISHHTPLTVSAFAILFAMIAPLFVRETKFASFAGTLVWMYLTASVAYLAAAMAGPDKILGDIGFLLVFFAGILCQACGPRALGCALASIVTYYLGLYLAPTWDHIGASFLLSLPALLIIILVVRCLLPARPILILQRATSGVLTRASKLEALLNEAVLNPTRLDQQISSLNEAALALEEHLSLLPVTDARSDAIRTCLVELEVAAGQCHYAKPSSAKTTPLEGLSALRMAMTQLRYIMRSAGAVAALPHHAMRNEVAPSPSVQASSTARKWRDFTSRLSWLHAARATTAALLAMLLGHSLSPERWFWAVITVFVVFLGTRSRADTIHRGFERVAGTLAGALVSAGLALALHGMTAWLVLAMVLCVFGWSYFILSAYSRGVFFITVLVGLVYSELGFAIGPLVAIRIEEVLLGCGISFAVAALLFPLSAKAHIDSRVLGVLKALRDVVAAQAGGRPASSAQRQVEKRWHELRTAFRPFQTQRVFAWNPGCELVGGSLLACLHWSRTLTTSTPTSANARQFNAILHQLDVLIGQYTGNTVLPDAPSIRDVKGIDTSSLELGTPHSEESDKLQEQTLSQFEACIGQLAERLGYSPARPSGIRWAFGTTGS